MQASKINFNSTGHKLVGLLEVPNHSNKPFVILLHGLSNSMKDCPLINEAASTLHKQGFPTFRFDYYGSGGSEGLFIDKTFSIMVKNTEDAYKYLMDNYKVTKMGIWGRSLGAILGATISDNPGVIASVFLSTTVHTNISFSTFFNKNKKFSLPIKGTGKIKGEPILTKKFYEETEWMDRQQINHLSKAKNVLIIQGTEDKTVYDPSWAEEIYKLTLEPKKLLYIKGANHAYTGFESKAINEGVNWLTERST